MERKNGGGNSDTTEVMPVKLLQGVEGIYFEPPANSGQHCHILRQLIVKSFKAWM